MNRPDNQQRFRNGFTRGLSEVAYKHFPEIEDELKVATGSNNPTTYANYKYGRQLLLAEKAENVEQVFKKFGVPVSKVWGKFKLAKVGLKQT